MFENPETVARSSLRQRLQAVRARTVALVAPLSAEDLQLQSMPDASPAKWHLAHTSWFFDTLVLQPHARGWSALDVTWARLFNSYYEALGARHPRPQRGLLSRPSLAEVLGYRERVEQALDGFIAEVDADTLAQAMPLLELGLQHEQQHQELLLTDLLHAFSVNPLLPAVLAAPLTLPDPAGPSGWHTHPGGEVAIGHDGAGFAFDNEEPRHRVLLQPFALAQRLVSNADFLQFVLDGGYRRASLWLSEGWAQVQAQGWQAPLYWHGVDAMAAAGPAASARPQAPQAEFGLQGLQAWQPDTPVRHLSFYEAAAYAEWAGARLPTEFEWEAAASTGAPALHALYGQAWQWTRSSYDPYPRFRPPAGAVGEYNGKFMVGQVVLRGSSLATPPGHARRTYRNFFPPQTRWQFSGLRLARDL